MCGIVGQLAFGECDKEMEATRQESMIFFGSELLQMTQEKGKDATGVSLLFGDGNYIGLKMGIPSIDFISRYGKTNKEYGGFIKVWRKSSKTGKVFLGHCRQTTRGSALDNDNNHPIKVGEIIGIHNGTIQNDDTIFEKLSCDRTGVVDSEAIFRLLHHYTKNGTEPFTIDMMKEVVRKLAGTFAVMAFSGNNPYQVCAFRDRRPIEMALIKPLKLALCATERKFIETSIYRYNKYINLYMPGSKFPTLRKDDVEFKALIDDSAVIFDLRTEVNKDTEIGDLYDWEKMPRERVWGHGTGNHYTPTADTNPLASKTGAPAVNAAKKNAAPHTANSTPSGFIPAEEKKDDRPAGRVWIRAINGYAAEDSEEVRQAKGVGSIEINIATGKTNELSPPEEEHGKFVLESGDKNIENNAGPKQLAEIEKLVPAETGGQAADGAEPVDGVEEMLNGQGMKTVEVDASVDAKALETAEEAARWVQQYENEEEVLADLEVQDSETLRKIPVASLANRIQKFVYKKGIYKGYLLRKAEEDAIGEDKKGKAAEKNIRVLKTVVKILLRIVRFSGYVNNHTLDMAVADTFENGEEVSKDTLDRLFTAGDERKYSFLRRVKSVVNEKEKR